MKKFNYFSFALYLACFLFALGFLSGAKDYFMKTMDTHVTPALEDLESYPLYSTQTSKDFFDSHITKNQTTSNKVDEDFPVVDEEVSSTGNMTIYIVISVIIIIISVVIVVYVKNRRRNGLY